MGSLQSSRPVGLLGCRQCPARVGSCSILNRQGVAPRTLLGCRLWHVVVHGLNARLFGAAGLACAVLVLLSAVTILSAQEGVHTGDHVPDPTALFITWPHTLSGWCNPRPRT